MIISPVLFAERIATPLERPPYISNEVIIKLRDSQAVTPIPMSVKNAVKSKAKLPPNDPLTRLRNEFGMRVVRRLHSGIERSDQGVRLHSVLQQKADRKIRPPAASDVAVPDLSNIYKLEVDPQGQLSMEDFIAVLRKDPDVEYVERNQVVSVDYIPNDPYFSSQWYLHNEGQPFPASRGVSRMGSAGADIQAEAAWERATKDTEVIVAVVDTGVAAMTLAQWPDASVEEVTDRLRFGACDPGTVPI